MRRMTLDANGQSAPLKCSRVAVIGGGSAGIIAAKYLRAEKCFDSIVVYEQRDIAGGLWQYTPHHRNDAYFSVPQTHPELGPEIPVAPDPSSKGTVFVTPVYEALETNIPRQLMELSDFQFPSEFPLFPSHSEILEYLQDYASDASEYVRYGRQVIDVLPRRMDQQERLADFNGWVVESVKIKDGTVEFDEFDAVVVANGHYAVPFIPAISGLSQWVEQYPGTVSHSKYFRSAREFSDKRVVVVGNSASGLDIATQLDAVCKPPIYLSQKSVSDMETGSYDSSRIETMSEISSVHAGTRQVTMTDGQQINEVDAILFCTGYFYSFPFLRKAVPELTTDGSMVNGTYQHIFLASNPTLAFLALPQKVIPFPVAETQAAVVARVFAGRLSLPAIPIMQDWEREMLKKCGRTDRFHTFGFPSDADYMDMLVSWADQAVLGSKLENENRGKMAHRWNARKRWIRQKIPLIKQAYIKEGDARLKIRSIEALGFHYRDGSYASN